METLIHFRGFPKPPCIHQSGKDAEEEMEVVIGATEVCAPWSNKEIHEAQRNDQIISQVMQWKASYGRSRASGVARFLALGGRKYPHGLLEGLKARVF